MNLQVVYCNHHTANLGIRERLAFSRAQIPQAYSALRAAFPRAEWVVLSTCNRIEVYTAQDDSAHVPSHQDVARFFADFHQVPLAEFFDDLVERTGPDVVRHLFQVASSLDSMVLGEPQIVAQVKEAYALAQDHAAAGPLTNALFQRALKVAKRVRSETTLAEGRVSIASVAVGDFGKRIFDRFDDKTVLVIGAGEMAAETLRYLREAGANEVLVTNRTLARAEQTAAECGGRVCPFEQLDDWLCQADVIVTTTGATPPLVNRDRFRKVRQRSGRKPVFILDLGVPRDFEPSVSDLDDDVYLYCIDDLEAVCEQNRQARSGEVEKALEIIEEETEKFRSELYHRATGPIIKRLRDHHHGIVGDELTRLFARLPHLERDRAEIERSFEQLVNKLLHPPLEALRDEARDGTPHGLMNALKRLFRLHDE
ncbi:MAG: glutamyl-tRNA reductase [Planctomycetes bacterium]|nr:glutamyl-tRNA reductase [Planctomycetota bacterium]